MSKDWYRVCARQYSCNDHGKHPTGLDEAVAAYTGLSKTNAANVLDRLRHLSRCLGEPETITLYRLQQGKNQHPPAKREHDEL